MPERKLAHIEKIIDLQPIPGADKIEVATVLGWQCVVKKNDFHIGDLALYIEIDSIVPKIPYFDFMINRKYRVKTIKLRKQISQGLLISIKDLTNLVTFHIANKYINCLNWYEGQDITNWLNITKYESLSDKESNWTPQQKNKWPWYIKYFTRYQWFRKLFKIKSKSFPEFIPKTDEERVQNMPWICDKYKDKEFIATEKIDGQSATYWIRKKLLGYEFGICSRTVRKSEHDNSNWSKVAKQFNIKEKLIEISKWLKTDVAIQGEIISSKIQNGKYHNNHIKCVEFPYDFYVFNLYNINKKKYIDYHAMVSVLTLFELKLVPRISASEFNKLPSTIKELIEFSGGKSQLANIEREGIVIRTLDQKISFKVVNPKFLLKNND